MLKFIYAFEKFQYLTSSNVLLLYEEIDNFDGLGWVQPVLIVSSQLLLLVQSSDKNIRTKCGICPKLTINAPK